MEYIKSFEEFINEDYNQHESVDESMEWWEITKGLLAYDAIYAAIGVGAVGLFVASIYLKKAVAPVIDWFKAKKDAKEKSEIQAKVEEIGNKIKNDPDIIRLAQELQDYPFKDLSFKKHSLKDEEGQKMRKKLLSQLSDAVKRKLTKDELVFLKEINKFIRDSAAEEVVGVTESIRVQG